MGQNLANLVHAGLSRAKDLSTRDKQGQTRLDKKYSVVLSLNTSFVQKVAKKNILLISFEFRINISSVHKAGGYKIKKG